MMLDIWRFTDGKAGHDSQSIGLCQAIKEQISCHCFNIPARSTLNSLSHFLLKRFPIEGNIPTPNIMIGAGHATHLSMLAARRAFGGKVIVLMKPSLPLSFFDVCIVPEHDAVQENDTVITTLGALNPIRFNHKKDHAGLILLGGLSAHYHWDNTAILEQIDLVVSGHKNILWRIADSPRTPKNILARIKQKGYANVELLACRKTGTEKLHRLIYQSELIWVSPDSISMIYESLSSGASVGLFELADKNRSRIIAAIQNLIDKGVLATFSQYKKTGKVKPNTIKLNEAKRCALLLKERGLLHQRSVD